MENSIIYKEKYLKYKRDYLDLKEQINGGGAGGVKVFATYYALYVILDNSSYEALKRSVLHNELSIDYISRELLGCGLKIMEDSKDILFLSPGKKKGNARRQMRRRIGTVVDMLIPEYKFKENISNSKSVIATMTDPYSLGMIYTYGPFIEKLSKNITSKLFKKTKNDNKSYEEIQVEKPFIGTMLFRFSKTSCEFIEAHKLVPATDEPPPSNDPDDIQIVNIATIGETKMKLIKDEHIYNPKYSFMLINE
jgi:hypothetical protein